MIDELKQIKDVQHFPQIFEEMPIGIALLGLNHTFLRANKVLLNWFGYTEEELKTKTVAEITHKDDWEITAAALKRLSDGTEKSCSLEKRYITGNQEIVWVNATITLLSDGNCNPCCFNAFVQNITERKRAEQERLESQKLLQQLNVDLTERITELAYANEQLELLTEKALTASRLKSEFVANISHELRTPLSASIGLAELLLETELEPEQAQLAENIFHAGNLLLEMINRLLDFSKIEAGQMDIKIMEFCLCSEVNACVEILMPSAQVKKLSLSTRIDPDIPALLKGDSLRVRQVLSHLTSNAIKFTDSGKVELHAKLQDKSSDSVTICFAVIDSGIGLSKQAQEHIFEPFVQANGTSTRRHGGTGLGLTISQRFVELMGGQLDVESREGSGSCFSFTLKFDCV